MSEEHMQGATYIVPRELVPVLYSEYLKQLENNYKINVADDDQGIHLAIYQRHPEMYHPIYTEVFGKIYRVLS
jgi:hypothetical protein